MNVSPRQVIAVEFFTLFILWLAISARTYLIWNKPPSWQKIACQALLYAACVLDTVAVAIICNLTFRQLKFRDAYPQEVAIPLLFVRDSFNAMNYFLAYLFYYACVCTAKAAYLVFFAELYSKIETKARPLLYATMVFWALSSLTGFLMFFLWCKPLSANWNITFTLGTVPRCPSWTVFRVTMGLGAMLLVTDLSILLLPIVVISQMRFSRAKTFGMVMVCSMGTISIIATAIRTTFFGTLSVKSVITDWGAVNASIVLTAVEIFFGVLALMLPSFQPVIIRLDNYIQSLRHAQPPSANFGNLGIPGFPVSSTNEGA